MAKMDTNVINLVSSDEEDNDGKTKNKIKSNKNITVKRVKTLNLPQNVNKIQTQTQKVTSPSVLHPPNNNNKKQLLLTQTFKPQKILPHKQSNKEQPQFVISSIKSGITITPVKNKDVSVTKSPNNSIVSNVGSTTIKPRTETVKNVSKPITPPATVHVKPIGSVNVAIAKKPTKRVTPRKISDTVTMRTSSMEKSSDSDMQSRDSLSADSVPHSMLNGKSKRTDEQGEPPMKRPKIAANETKTFHPDYVHLIEACKNADSTKDMDKIVTKLEKYYHRAHTEYVNSKSFNKIVINVTNEIKAEPKLVYMKIKGVLDELRTRRSNGESAEQLIDDPAVKEMDEKKAKKIQTLSDALRVLQGKIRKCEESEVDWDDELNSKYLMTERYKKRACDIYEKLCDLTGESRSAERIVKKPIKFNDTAYPEFNRKLEKFINETKLFPDMFDVLRIMDHCSKLYDYRLSTEDRKQIAQLAFHKVGTLLQKRRKADLYEMVQYFTANESDPAVEDTSLKSKLEENQRHYTKRMKEVIERFSMHHGDSEAKEDEKEKSPVKNVPKTVSSSKKVPTTSSSSCKKPQDPPPVVKDHIDLVNDSIEYISDDGGAAYNNVDEILIDEHDVVDLEKEFLPTITSVTSLHPEAFNNLMNFPSSQSTEIS
ncbi:daxx-like protein [Contarinia nasturtii]|uniref:daxx-like protein n=1 Tax=Contarinia nasturtii TaxID=265458 RepID=UPI0012D49C86|nr:daxx-like protein [Contarinia nasturtii]